MKKIRAHVVVLSFLVVASGQAGVSRWDVRAGADYEVPLSAYVAATQTATDPLLSGPSNYFTLQIELPLLPSDFANVKKWVCQMDVYSADLSDFLKKQKVTINSYLTTIPGLDILGDKIVSNSGKMGRWIFAVVGTAKSGALMIRLSVPIDEPLAKKMHDFFYDMNTSSPWHPSTINRGTVLATLQSISAGISATDFPGASEVLKAALALP